MNACAADSSANRPDPVLFDFAISLLTGATEALSGWQPRITTSTHTYVADWHEVIRRVDDLARELYRVRITICDERRWDEGERAARLDQLTPRQPTTDPSGQPLPRGEGVDR